MSKNTGSSRKLNAKYQQDESSSEDECSDGSLDSFIVHDTNQLVDDEDFGKKAKDQFKGKGITSLFTAPKMRQYTKSSSVGNDDEYLDIIEGLYDDDDKGGNGDFGSQHKSSSSVSVGYEATDWGISASTTSTFDNDNDVLIDHLLAAPIKTKSESTADTKDSTLVAAPTAPVSAPPGIIPSSGATMDAMVDDDPIDLKGEEVDEASYSAFESSNVNTATYDHGEDYMVYFYNAYSHDVLRDGRLYVFGRILSSTHQMPTADGDNAQSDGSRNKVPSEQITTQSCCIVVDSVPRVMYFLPRQYHLNDPHDLSSVDTSRPVTMDDVKAEVRELLTGLNIKAFRSRKQSKKYCFGRRVDEVIRQSNTGAIKSETPYTSSLLDPVNVIPAEADYLEVQYSSELQGLPSTLSGRTFSHVLGTQTSKTELFLLNRQIHGPMWVKIPKEKATMVTSTASKASWCKVELQVATPNAIVPYRPDPRSHVVLSPPLFSMASIYFQTYLHSTPQHGANQHDHQVVMISIKYDPSVAIDSGTADHQNPRACPTLTLICPPTNGKLPLDLESNPQSFQPKGMSGRIQVCANERALLATFFSRLAILDPDFIMGHDLYGMMLDQLFHRAHEVYKLGIECSKLGRLKMRNPPSRGRRGGQRSLVDFGAGAGRLMCDTMICSREFHQAKNHALEYLVSTMFNVDLTMIDPRTIPHYYAQSNQLRVLIAANLQRLTHQYKILFQLNIVPLTQELTSLCGNLWASTLRGARSERVEYILLHDFVRRGYIPPEPQTSQPTPFNDVLTPEQKTYSGGLVLEPKRGFYEHWIAVLDFNSLYPSIIREYNLCFSTTKHWSFDEEQGDKDNEFNQFLPARTNNDKDAGVLPRVVSLLIERRKAVRLLIPEAESDKERKGYETKQLALKLVANSMYGCLGFPLSRFYCRPIAACITHFGRQALVKARETAEKFEVDVIYGDTDSLMVNTGTYSFDEARRKADQIKRAVNRGYKALYIDEDGFFRNILLVQKKKYAALKHVLTEPFSVHTLESLRKKYEIDTRGKQQYKIEPYPPISRETPSPTHINVSKLEVKGLDLVRRDWSGLCNLESLNVLYDILWSSSRDDIRSAIKVRLEGIRKNLDEDKYPIQSFIISKQLTRSLDQYKDGKNIAHVAVAAELHRLGKYVRNGDIIEYVIAKPDGVDENTASNNLGLAQRAMAKQLYEDNLRQKSLQAQNTMGDNAPAAATNGQPAQTFYSIDVTYYKEHQLLDPIYRLCEVFSDITPKELLAEWLGLDPKRYRHVQPRSGDGESHADDGFIPNSLQDADFSQCKPLYITCHRCHAAFPFLGVYSFFPLPSTLAADGSLTHGAIAPAFHSSAYRSKLVDDYYIQKRPDGRKTWAFSGLICPTPTCPGLFTRDGNDETNQDILSTLTAALFNDFNHHFSSYHFRVYRLFNQSSNMYNYTVNPLLRGELLAKNDDIKQRLSYYKYLFDVESAEKRLYQETRQYIRAKRSTVGAADQQALTSHIIPELVAKFPADYQPDKPEGLPVLDDELKKVFDEMANKIRDLDLESGQRSVDMGSLLQGLQLATLRKYPPRQENTNNTNDSSSGQNQNQNSLDSDYTTIYNDAKVYHG